MCSTAMRVDPVPERDRRSRRISPQSESVRRLTGRLSARRRRPVWSESSRPLASSAAPASVKSRTLADLIKFNEEHRAEELPFFGQEIFEQSEKRGPLTDKKYLAALAKNHRLARTEGIDATLAKHKVDAIIAPTGGPVWATDLVNGDHFTGGYSSASAVAGYPHIT